MAKGLEDPSKKGLLALVIGACILLGLFIAFRIPAGSPTQMVGVVQASGTMSVSKYQGGTREAASVLLANGRVVSAYVASGGPLSHGDKVQVLEQRRLLGWPAYQVIAREPAQ